MKRLKKIFGLLLVVSVFAFGSVKSELKKDEYGKYSGSATLKIVARGRIVKPVSTEMLVISSDSEDINSIEFRHNGLKEGENKITSKKITAQILEKDENGNYIVAKRKGEIIAKLENKEKANEIVNIDKDLKNLEGKSIAKVSYNLKEKNTLNSYVGEVTSDLRIKDTAKGNFIDNSMAVAIVVR